MGVPPLVLRGDSVSDRIIMCQEKQTLWSPNAFASVESGRNAERREVWTIGG
jgi:hypothetical protein